MRRVHPLLPKPITDFRDLTKLDSLTTSGIYFINDVWDIKNTLNDERKSFPYIQKKRDTAGNYIGAFGDWLKKYLQNNFYNDQNEKDNDNRTDQGKFMLGGQEFDNGDFLGFEYSTLGGYPSFLNGRRTGSSSYKGLNINKSLRFNFQNDLPMSSTTLSDDKDYGPFLPSTFFVDYKYSPSSFKGDGKRHFNGPDPFAALGVLIVQGTDHFCIQKFINREYIFYRYKRNGKWGNWKHNIPNNTSYVENYGQAEYERGIRKDFDNMIYPLGFGSLHNEKGITLHPKDVIAYFGSKYQGIEPLGKEEFDKMVKSVLRKSEINKLIKSAGDKDISNLTAKTLIMNAKNRSPLTNTPFIFYSENNPVELKDGDEYGIKSIKDDTIHNIVTNTYYTNNRDKEMKQTIGDSNLDLLFHVGNEGLYVRSATANYLRGYNHEKPFVNGIDESRDMLQILTKKSMKWELLFKADNNTYIRELNLASDVWEVLIFVKIRSGHYLKRYYRPLQIRTFKTIYEAPRDGNYQSAQRNHYERENVNYHIPDSRTRFNTFFSNTTLPNVQTDGKAWYFGVQLSPNNDKITITAPNEAFFDKVYVRKMYKY